MSIATAAVSLGDKYRITKYDDVPFERNTTFFSSAAQTIGIDGDKYSVEDDRYSSDEVRDILSIIPSEGSPKDIMEEVAVEIQNKVENEDDDSMEEEIKEEKAPMTFVTFNYDAEVEEESDLNVLRRVICHGFTFTDTLCGECVPVTKRNYQQDLSDSDSEISHLDETSHLDENSLCSFESDERNDRSFISHEEYNDRSYVSMEPSYVSMEPSYVSYNHESVQKSASTQPTYNHESVQKSASTQPTYNHESIQKSASTQPTSLDLNTIETKRLPLSSFHLDNTTQVSMLSLNRATSQDVSTNFEDLQSKLLQPDEDSVFDGVSEDGDNHSIEIVAALDRVSRRILAGRNVDILDLTEAENNNENSSKLKHNLNTTPKNENMNVVTPPQSHEKPKTEETQNEKKSVHFVQTKSEKTRKVSRDEQNTPTTSCSSATIERIEGMCDINTNPPSNQYADHILFYPTDEIFHSIPPCPSIEVHLPYRSPHSTPQAFSPSSMNVEDMLSHGESPTTIVKKSPTKMAKLVNGLSKTFKRRPKCIHLSAEI